MDNIIDYKTLQQVRVSMEAGLTQSEIMTRMNCARKHFFRYILMKKKQGSFSWALLFGDAIHQMLEEYYRGRDTAATVPDFRFEEDVILRPDQMEEYYFYKKLATVIVLAHNQYWFNFDDQMEIVANEEILEYEYRGIKLRGKIDMCIYPSKNSGIFVMDHKTTYIFDPSVFLGWSFRFQFLFYAWLWWKVKGRYPAGMYVNAIRKPAERRSVKKKETIDDFIKRIAGNIAAEPSHYFIRERMPFTRGTLERFETFTLNPIINQFEQLGGASRLSYEETLDANVGDTIDSLLLSLNTDHCQVYNRSCEFLELCANALQDHACEYINMKTKHPELYK